MKKIVLLINIGSPDTMSVSDTRRYLRKFLMDKRVIDISFVFRFLLVNGIIAPFRAPKSLKSYQRILIQNQSPLIYYSYLLKDKLQQVLGEQYAVKIAMMYGKPYLINVLHEIKQQPVSDIILVPLYPQYASSTTGSALEMVLNKIKNWQVIPNIKTVHTFYKEQAFIDLWVKQIKKHLPQEYDFILFSYHGLPERQIYKADNQFSEKHCHLNDCCNTSRSKNEFCYRYNCLYTTRLIADRLGIDESKIGSCFQSRLGQAEWLQPYTSKCIQELSGQGIKKLVVISPAFVTDCLETLFEIGIEYAELFKHLGGKELTLIPSLNAEEEWVKFLSQLLTK